MTIGESNCGSDRFPVQVQVRSTTHAAITKACCSCAMIT